MKVNQKKIITFYITFLFSSLLVGQNYAPTKDVDVLKKQETVLIKTHPKEFKQLKIVAVYNLNDQHTAIGFLKDNIYSEVIVNSDRKDMLLIANSVEINSKKAPEIIKDVWKKEYENDWVLDKILYTTTPYGESYYTLTSYHTSTNGEKKWKRVFYNKTGQQQSRLF